MRALRKPRILMVDDDPDIHVIIRGWLASGYEFSSLLSGEGLRDTLLSLESDLLILDIGLPGSDGVKLCDKIRSDPRFAGLPVLFMTAFRDDEHFIDGIGAGASAYLNKPVERRKFLSLVRELLAAGAAA